jgi:hypothetical protein
MISPLENRVKRFYVVACLLGAAMSAEPLVGQEYESVPQMGLRASAITVHDDRFLGAMASFPLDWNMEIGAGFDLSLTGQESTWVATLDFLSRFGPAKVLYLGGGGLVFGVKDPLRPDGRLEESTAWSAFAGLEFRRRYDQALRPHIEVRTIRLGQQSLFRLSAGLSFALERPR